MSTYVTIVPNPEPDEMSWRNLECVLNDRGHLILLTRGEPVQKIAITGASTVTLDADEFVGMAVSTVMAAGTVSFYDGATATGEPFLVLPTTALSTLTNSLLPHSIHLPSDKLTIKPSAASTAKFTVFYR